MKKDLFKLVLIVAGAAGLTACDDIREDCWEFSYSTMSDGKIRQNSWTECGLTKEGAEHRREDIQAGLRACLEFSAEAIL